MLINELNTSIVLMIIAGLVSLSVGIADAFKGGYDWIFAVIWLIFSLCWLVLAYNKIKLKREIWTDQD